MRVRVIWCVLRVSGLMFVIFFFSFPCRVANLESALTNVLSEDPAKNVKSIPPISPTAINGYEIINSLTPWQHRTWTTLVQAMVCCLMAPSHYLNQCWLTINEVLWHSIEGNFIWKYIKQCIVLGNSHLKLPLYFPVTNELNNFSVIMYYLFVLYCLVCVVLLLCIECMHLLLLV